MFHVKQSDMNRFTKKNDSGYTVIDKTQFDSAINQLGLYEDQLESMTKEVEELSNKMELLRSQNKEKSVQFRQLFSQRYILKETLRLFMKEDD